MLRVELNFRNLLLLLGLVVVALVTWRARAVVLELGFALMIMATLHPLVQLGERRGLSHGWAVALAMLSLVLVPLLILALLTPLLIGEVQGIANSVPQFEARITELVRNAGLASQVNAWVAKANLQDRIGALAVVSAQQTVSLVAEAFTVVVIAGYLLADSRRIQLWLHALVPRRSEHHIEPLLTGMERVVGGYIRGQLVTSALFGAFAFVVCVVCRVHYPLLLALVAFVGDIIPIFGVPLAMIVTGAVAVLQSTWQPIAVLSTYTVYQQLEGHVLMPRIYARTVNMPPLLIIVATIAGGTLDGMVGILIGIPVAGAIKVVFDYVVAERLRGRAAADTTMAQEPTDTLERAVKGESEQEPVVALEPELGPDGEIVPSYSPFESLPVEKPVALVAGPSRLPGTRMVTVRRRTRRRTATRVSRASRPPTSTVVPLLPVLLSHDVVRSTALEEDAAGL